MHISIPHLFFSSPSYYICIIFSILVAAFFHVQLYSIQISCNSRPQYSLVCPSLLPRSFSFPVLFLSYHQTLFSPPFNNFAPLTSLYWSFHFYTTPCTFQTFHALSLSFLSSPRCHFTSFNFAPSLNFLSSVIFTYIYLLFVTHHHRHHPYCYPSNHFSFSSLILFRMSIYFPALLSSPFRASLSALSFTSHISSPSLPGALFLSPSSPSLLGHS